MRLRRRRVVKLASRSLRLTNERGAGHHSRLFIDGVDVSEMTHRVEIDNPVDGPVTATVHLNPWPVLAEFTLVDVLAIFDPDPTEDVPHGAVNAMELALAALEHESDLAGYNGESTLVRERAIEALRDALDDAPTGTAEVSLDGDDGTWVHAGPDVMRPGEGLH